jgi:hypothetical protein
VQISQIPAARALLLIATASLLSSACGSSSSGAGAPNNTGQSCGVAADCYSSLASGSVHGEVECLTRVPNGYCTHLCTADTDCCAVPGECPQALNEVCGPFESTGLQECFLTCEDNAVTAAGFTDSTVFCQRYASAAFICRSTGGGSNNRKVCVPDG